MFKIIGNVKQKFLLLSGLALLSGICWIAFALGYALFRDTTESMTMAARATPTITPRPVSPEQLAVARDGYLFWFRQRTSSQAMLIEQAQVDQSRMSWSKPNR